MRRLDRDAQGGIALSWVELGDLSLGTEAQLLLLNADERRTAFQLESGPTRDQYVVGRAFVRARVGAALGLRPNHVRFARSALGKPRVVNGSAVLHFSVAKSDGMIACAISREGEVGIDVEHVEREVQMLAISERHFAAHETRELWAASEAQRKARFFELWVLKEAYAKARGVGLTLPLDHCSFQFSCDRRVEPCTDASDLTWSYWLAHLSSSHVLALVHPRKDTPSSVSCTRYICSSRAARGGDPFESSAPPFTLQQVDSL